jgi:hypothetical protein
MYFLNFSHPYKVYSEKKVWGGRGIYYFQTCCHTSGSRHNLVWCKICLKSQSLHIVYVLGLKQCHKNEVTVTLTFDHKVKKLIINYITYIFVCIYIPHVSVSCIEMRLWPWMLTSMSNKSILYLYWVQVPSYFVCICTSIVVRSLWPSPLLITRSNNSFSLWCKFHMNMY